MKVEIVALPVLCIIWLTGASGDPANAAAIPSQVSSTESPTGPGYELQVSNAIYGYNAPQVNSLPNNPTGGVQKCFTPTWGTCTGIGLASTGDYTSPGYWVGSAAQYVGVNGQTQYGGEVFGFGNTDTCNQVSTVVSNAPVVGIASAQFGALLVAADRGYFTFCGALFYGSMGGQHLNQPMVAIAANPDGTGYWTAAADGGVFFFGDAPFRGSATGGGTLEGIAANG